MRLQKIVGLAVIFLSTAAWASNIDEARALYDEAQEAMRKMSGVAADPKVYAEAMRKLEKAQDLLEAKPGADDALEQSVSSALFWAKKFANVHVIEALKTTPPLPGTSDSGKTTPEKPKEPPKENTAETEFKKAEAFAQAHAGDDYAIALRWFQVADNFTGTDYSIRAQARAQEAQARYQAAQAKKAGNEPQTEDAKLIAAGNELFLQKQFAEAIAKFEEAKKIADTPIVERRIGHANYELAFQASDEYTTKYLDLKAKKDTKGLAGLKPLVEKAHSFYKAAEAAFKKGLELAKGKDLDCETQLGFICFYNGKNAGLQARALLGAMLNKYSPGNDEERTLYEGGKSLFKKLGGT